MFPYTASTMIDAHINSLAEKNIGLLHAFIAHNWRYISRAGGKRELFSMLAPYYLTGITAYVFRKDKHSDLQLSTFVFKCLRWNLRKCIVHDSTLIRMPEYAEAKEVVMFHGREGKCITARLLVTDAHDGIDRIALTDEIKKAFLFLDNRTRDMVVMRVMQGKTLEECGYAFRVSKEAVRARVASGMWKLRKLYGKNLFKFVGAD